MPRKKSSTNTKRKFKPEIRYLPKPGVVRKTTKPNFIALARSRGFQIGYSLMLKGKHVPDKEARHFEGSMKDCRTEASHYDEKFDQAEAESAYRAAKMEQFGYGNV